SDREASLSYGPSLQSESSLLILLAVCFYQGSRGCAPLLDDQPIGHSSQRAAVTGKCYSHRIEAGSKGGQFLSGLPIPQPHGAIKSSRCQPSAVRGKSQCTDLLGMPGHLPDFAPAGNVPDADQIVIRRQQLAALRSKSNLGTS